MKNDCDWLPGLGTGLRIDDAGMALYLVSLTVWAMILKIQKKLVDAIRHTHVRLSEGVVKTSRLHR